MHSICKIDRKIYSCISKDIATDEVVITDERIRHSNLHNGAFEKYGQYLPGILESPDYIFEDGGRPNTGLVIGRIKDLEGRFLQIVLRIKIAADPDDYKNSIISCWDISESRLGNYRRNRAMLYKKSES